LAGLNIGSKSSSGGVGGNTRNTGGKDKKKNREKPKLPPNRLGVTKEMFSSRYINDNWEYTLKLNSDQKQHIKVAMLPASDALRVSVNDIVKINKISVQWKQLNDNEIVAEFEEDESKEAIFILDSKNRLGLNFKITRIDEI